jgi:hypothetical protein
MLCARTAWTDFVVAVLTTAAVHQPLVALVRTVADTPWVAFDMRATAPFGVPAVLTAILFGGLWGIPLGTLARRWAVYRSGAIRAALVVAPATVLVGAALTLMRDDAIGEQHPLGLLAAALVINVMWGAVTAMLQRRA